MKREYEPKGVRLSICGLAIDAWTELASDSRAATRSIVERFRRRWKTIDELDQLAQMGERQWADIGLTKCDVVREIEKSPAVP